jgi:hypothetical protein
MFRSKPYLNFIRSKPCVLCQHPISHAHHEALHRAGMGIKAPDSHAVPLCVECHALRHRVGKDTFWKNTNIEMLIIGYLTEWMEENNE